MLEARTIVKARARHVAENITNQKTARRPWQNIKNQKRARGPGQNMPNQKRARRPGCKETFETPRNTHFCQGLEL